MGMKRLAVKGDEIGEAVLEAPSMSDHELISNLHADMLKLTKAVNRLSETIEPVAEHLPALVEVAHVWNTGKAVGRTARIVAGFLKWLAGVAVSIAALYLLIHSRYADVVGLHH